MKNHKISERAFVLSKKKLCLCYVPQLNLAFFFSALLFEMGEVKGLSSVSCPKWSETATCWSGVFSCLSLTFALVFMITIGVVTGDKCERLKTTCVLSPDGYWRPEWADNFTVSCEYMHGNKTKLNCYYDSERLGPCPVEHCRFTDFTETLVLMYIASVFIGLSCCVLMVACCGSATLEHTHDSYDIY